MQGRAVHGVNDQAAEGTKVESLAGKGSKIVVAALRVGAPDSQTE